MLLTGLGVVGDLVGDVSGSASSLWFGSVSDSSLTETSEPGRGGDGLTSPRRSPIFGFGPVVPDETEFVWGSPWGKVERLPWAPPPSHVGAGAVTSRRLCPEWPTGSQGCPRLVHGRTGSSEGVCEASEAGDHLPTCPCTGAWPGTHRLPNPGRLVVTHCGDSWRGTRRDRLPRWGVLLRKGLSGPHFPQLQSEWGCTWTR